MADEKINLRDVPKEDILQGLALLNKEKERKRRIQSGEIKGGQKWSELSPESKRKRLDGAKKYRIKAQLMMKKAAQQGVKVTDAEIEQAMKAGK